MRRGVPTESATVDEEESQTQTATQAPTGATRSGRTKVDMGIHEHLSTCASLDVGRQAHQASAAHDDTGMHLLRDETSPSRLRRTRASSGHRGRSQALDAPEHLQAAAEGTARAGEAGRDQTKETNEERTVTGIIVNILEAKGYFFIRGADDEVEYFAHKSALHESRWEDVVYGRECTFVPDGNASKGPRAERVVIHLPSINQPSMR